MLAVNMYQSACLMYVKIRPSKQLLGRNKTSKLYLCMHPCECQYGSRQGGKGGTVSQKLANVLFPSPAPY